MTTVTQIVYKQGDVFSHQSTKNVIIPHVCNDLGAWGSGFVLAISTQHPGPERHYRNWYTTGVNLRDGRFRLGAVQFVAIGYKLYIANMIGQHGVGSRYGIPIRYGAIREALQKVRKFALEINAEIAAPVFGAGLAGGNWQIIEKIIQEELCGYGVPVTIYQFAQP